MKTLTLTTADSSILTYLTSAFAADHDVPEEQLTKLYSGLTGDGQEIASALLKIKHKKIGSPTRKPSEPAMETAKSFLVWAGI